MDTVGLLLRVAGSLLAVLGLVWMVRRGMLRSGGGRVRAAVGAVTVLSRQQLSGRASLALVQVGQLGLVVGVTDQGVTLLAERPVDELLAAPADVVTGAGRPARAPRREPVELPVEAAAREGFSRELAARLAEVDADAATSPASGGRATSPARPGPAAPQTVAPETVVPAQRRSSPLAGSALSPATWSQAVDVLRARTVRR
ncbi:FliO/MopB family protein [Pseudokineococcus sp. 1T1Z-3]|uniref:FliO/MopB family protein n=1 Tax=Pseudokineococcus sp. 1T1Z-3 TaxID=3132745 RepID=UPI0030A77DE1